MSKIIKSLHAVPAEAETKTISIRNLFEQMDFQEIHHVDQGKAEVETKVPTDEEIASRIEQQLLEAKERADQIIEEAEAHAKAIHEELQSLREQAEEEMKESILTAREQGYQEGFTQGHRDGQQDYEHLIEQAKTIISQSEQEFEKTIDSAEPVMIDLAAALTRRMIGMSLEEKPEIWSSLLKQVMVEVREHEHVKLYVHPDWYLQTSQQKEELEQLLSHTEKLYIYPDAGLMENGCMVESKHGRIDATLDRQLQELKTQLLEKWKEGSN